MLSSQERVTTIRVSYWRLFRLIFVIFYLYLLGDVFFRWGGFKYYGSFSEYLPSVALITILWTIVSVFTAMLAWMPLRAFEWICQHLGRKIRTEHLLLFTGIFIMFTGIFIFLGTSDWIGRQYIWPYVQATLRLKLIVFLGLTLSVIFLTWLFRYKSERWIRTIEDRINPLVWLFSIWLIISVPLVAYHAWWKQTDNGESQKITQPSVVNKNQPNIILVTFDALTARDMSVYGYHRPTTPYISEWAKNASLFTRLQAESNSTTPTTASLMTGKRVWAHQVYHVFSYSKPVRSDIESLPLLLKKNGYFNMAFVANPVASIKRLGISNSFEIAPHGKEFNVQVFSLKVLIDQLLDQLFGDKIKFHGWFVQEDFIMYRLLKIFYRDVSDKTKPPEKAFNRFFDFIDNRPPEPFFTWIHLHPPHYPYLPPAPFIGTFDSSYRLKTYKDQMIAWGNTRGGEFKQEERASIDIMRARYDEFIKYCDKQFEDFITQLTIRNKLKNTVIILSSDHGESFEHNYREHSSSHLYEQVTHIPLIIKEPNQTDGRIINDLIEQIDIPPTILDLAGIPVPSWMEGRSLVPSMRGEKLSVKPIFSMTFENNPGPGHQITKGTIAVWEGDYKLIYYLEEGKCLLFNLKEDPDELNNLFDKEPEVGQRLLALIKDNLKKANERISREKGHSTLNH